MVLKDLWNTVKVDNYPHFKAYNGHLSLLYYKQMFSSFIWEKNSGVIRWYFSKISLSLLKKNTYFRRNKFFFIAERQCFLLAIEIKILCFDLRLKQQTTVCCSVNSIATHIPLLKTLATKMRGIIIHHIVYQYNFYIKWTRIHNFKEFFNLVSFCSLLTLLKTFTWCYYCDRHFSSLASYLEPFGLFSSQVIQHNCSMSDHPQSSSAINHSADASRLSFFLQELSKMTRQSGGAGRASVKLTFLSLSPPRTRPSFHPPPPLSITSSSVDETSRRFQKSNRLVHTKI